MQSACPVCVNAARARVRCAPCAGHARMFFRQKQSRKKVSAARTFCAAALVFPVLTQYSKVRKTQTEFFTGVYTVDITLQDFERAQQRLKGVLHHTELDLSATFSAMTGGNIYLKYENSQKTGSFKIRGASNKIAALVERGETGAVVASSAGNHAQGVAYAAHRFGIPATIVMPKTAPIAKAKATEGYGATVVLAGDCYDDAYARACEICEQEHATFLHPYNDPEVIAGQGTLGLEILGDLPTADVVIVPAGGGGLLAGVAACIKQINPRVQVIGVQAGVVASMYASRKAGKVTTVKDAATLADGIHVLTPGDLTFEMCQKYVDEIVTVSEDEIAAAILALLEVQKTVAEGAGATPVAAFMSGKVDTSKKTVCVVSGGNVDVTTLSRVITRGLTYTGRITTITTKLADRAGSLMNLLNVVSGTGANVVRIHHEREDVNSEVNACVVSMVLETRNSEHVQQIKDKLTEKGYSLLEA